MLSKTPKYQIEATFREAQERGQEHATDLKRFMGNLGGGDIGRESQSIALMTSFPVLKPLIERMGLQAAVQKKGMLSKLYRRIKDNLLAEREKPLDDLDWFSFKEVRYSGEQHLSYRLAFADKEHFSVLSGKTLLATGAVGSPVSIDDVSFTISKVPSNLRLKTPYSLVLKPWWIAVAELRSQLRINTQKAQKSILELKLLSRDRHLGRDLLNGLLEEYRRYLKSDHNQLVQDQIAYLQTKQAEICGTMTSVFEEYTGHLQNSLKRSGQIGLRREVEAMSAEHHILEKKLLSLELEWGGLSRMEFDDKAIVSIVDSPSSKVMLDILHKISDLRQQRDMIELTLPNDRTANRYEARIEELREIRSRMGEVKEALGRIESAPVAEESLFDVQASLESWMARLNLSRDEEREDLAGYLENYARLLSMQEKIVQEQIFYGSDIPDEFKGIDLATARALFMDYNGKLDQTAAAARHFERLRDEMSNPDFEVSSLSAVLSDPLSKRLIEEASAIALKLKDEKHRSEKEKDRWDEELVLQKRILKDHLDQLWKVEKMKSELIQEKIAGLQTLILGCITGQISVLQERLTDWIKERKRSLAAEKAILLEKVEEIRSGFSDLPDKWLREKWLNLKTQMGIKMIQALTEMVESKTIGSHLHHIESKPLDLAIAPSISCKPGIFLKTFLGAFLFGFAAFARSFFSAVLRGFPTSNEKLRAMRYPVRGEISSFCDGPAVHPLSGSDLEALRQISLFLGNAKVVGIVQGKGPDYSYALAEHLALTSIRPLIIRCDFQAKFHPRDLPGLLQAWKSETDELPIRSKESYHWVASGGYSPYGTEILRSPRFRQMIENLKKEYDAIFLVTRSPLESSESQACLSLCDRAVVTACGEPTEQLTPFIDWAYHEGMCRLAFLTAGSS